MKKNLLAIFLCVLLFNTKLFAQPNKPQQNIDIGCRTSEVMEALYKAHPEARKEAEKLNEFTRTFKSMSKGSTNYVIPIVFHVFGSTFNGKTVTDDVIKEALQKTNEDFQGLTIDWNSIIPEFDGVKKAINITFKLAQLDPNGNPTTGITYHPTMSGFGNGSGYDSQIQQYAWDNYKYMNVFIQNDLYDDGVTNNSGVSWYPNKNMSDNNIARTVYNGAYLGPNTDENFRSVLTHEFGHFFNLKHTFEGGCPDAISCIYSGDLCCDTPPANTSSMNGALNCEENVTNWQNFMDYTNNYAMFTIEQINRVEAALQDPTRNSLWQESNLIATGVAGSLGPRFTLTSNAFYEGLANDGAISTSIDLIAVDGAQFAVTGNLTEGVHFTTSNVPSGLTLKVMASSSTKCTISFSGTAASHAAVDNVSNIGITFLDAAIVGGVSSLYRATINNFAINFINPYSIVYEDITDITVNSTATWESFTLQNGVEFGAWYSAGNLRFETYTKPLVCAGATKNITPVALGTEIGSISNWIAGGAYPNEHFLRTPTYTAWDGLTAYIGFQFTVNGAICYGWFKVIVAADGLSYTITEYAYNEAPFTSIMAGQQTGGTMPILPPANLKLYNTTQIGCTISWDESTQPNVTGYEVSQNGTLIGTPTAPPFDVTGLTAGVYNFTVKATVSDGNTSFPGSIVYTIYNSWAGSYLLKGWTLRQNDPVLTGYFSNVPWRLLTNGDKSVKFNGNQIWPNKTAISGIGPWVLTIDDSGGDSSPMLVTISDPTNAAVTTNSAYDNRYDPATKTFYISVYWGTGPTNRAAVDTLVYYPDNTIPSPPINLTASNITPAGVTLNWSAPLNNLGVVGYEVYNGAVRIGTPSGTSLTVTGLSANTSYTFTVKSKEAFGNLSVASNELPVTTLADNQIPTVPANLAASNITNSSCKLTWTASTDDFGVKGYRIFQGLTIIGNSAVTNFNVTRLVGSTNYTFTVKAVDFGENLSDASNEAAITTLESFYCTATSSYADPSELNITNVTLANLNNSSTYTTGGYEDHLDKSANLIQNSPYTVTITLNNPGWDYNSLGIWIDWNQDKDFEDAGETIYLMNDQSMDYHKVFTVPSSAKVGSTRMRVRVQYSKDPYVCGADTYIGETEDYTIAVMDGLAPTIPTSLLASNITQTGFTLSWTASTDNVGVTDYEIFKDGTSIGTSATTSSNVTGLSVNTAYNFTVKAKDAAGNTSSASNALEVTTIDTEAPSIPTGLSATNTTQTGFTLSWTASTDNVGVDSYEVFQDGTSIGTSATTTFNVTGLSENTAYNFTVKAKDAESNISPASDVLSFIIDTELPTAPTNLSATSITQTGFTLSWTASTDNVGVTDYEVFKDGTSIGTSATASFNVTGLSASTLYSFTVKAKDAAGNISSASSALAVTTLNTGISINSQLSATTIFPNPNNGNFIIKLPELAFNVKVITYNSIGLEIANQEFVNALELHINNNLQSGVYVVKVIINNKALIQKIIVQ